jgi:PAS domain S-box-containing protein
MPWRWLRQGEVDTRRESSLDRRLVATLVVALLVASAFFAIFYVPQRRASRIERWRERLTAMADDRMSAIDEWLDGNLGDVRTIASFPATRELLAGGKSAARGRGASEAAHLEAVLTTSAQAHHYLGAYVLDRSATTVAASHGSVPLGAGCAQLARRAVETGAARADFCPQPGAGSLVAFVAVVDAGAGGPSGNGAGAASTTIDPQAWLFPFLEHEPVPTRTGETLLVRSSGERATPLSPRRFPRNPTATSDGLVRPAGADGSPAGARQTGFGAYVDYRGVAVLAAIRRLRNAPWSVVVKVDREEALAGFRRELLGTGLVVGALIVAIAGAVYGLWRRQRAEHLDALAETRARYSLVLADANDAIMFLGPDHRILDCNSRTEEMYGYSRDELLGRHIVELREDGDSPDFREAMKDLHASQALVFDAQHVRKDGTSFPVEVSSRIVLVGGDEVRLSIVRDVSERARAEARIAALNRLFHTISLIDQLILREGDRDRLLSEACRIVVEEGGFRTAWVGMADRERGEVVPVAAAGVEPGNLAGVGVRCDDSPHGRGPTGTAIREERTTVVDDTESDPAYAPWRAMARARGFRASAAFPIRQAGRVIGALNVIATEPGAFRDDFASLLEDLAADIGFALGAIEDREERARGEATLRRERDFTNAVLDTLGALVVVLDPAGRIARFNRACEQATGYRFEEVWGKEIWDLFLVAEEKDELRALFGQLTAGQFPIEHENVWVTRDGRRLLVHWDNTALTAQDGSVEYVIATGIDVTEQRRMEQQLQQVQRMEAVGRLAGGVAHDFNNLLQAMLGLTSVLRAESNASERFAGKLDELSEHIKRGAQLTRQLLLFSRRETAKPERIDLNEVVQDSTRLLRRLLRENIALEVQVAADRLPLEADRGQLEQVLVNLAVNASDAMPEGGRLTIRTGSDGQQWVWVEVSDTGVGIASAAREHIFEPFFTTKSAGAGTGLGLAVVHGIVTRHRGRIELTSEVGRGTTFRVAMPRTGSGNYAAVADEFRDNTVTGPSRGERVLVVEDEPAAREGLADLLSMLGYGVVALESAEEALRLPAEAHFDAMLTDLLLPGISGTDLALGLSKRWPHLRVILMSGYTEDEAVRQGVQAGVVRFLQKPFDVETLARELRAALDSEETAG